MTKEINDIIAAFRDAQTHGRQTALATVVHVEGSSYRRPGARMLVEDTGKMTGAISGGCLEGDALRKASLAINQKANKLVTYNTLDEDDVAFGVQLGCNGIVHILFEPINPTRANHPIVLLEKCIQRRTDSVLVTLFSLKDYYGHQPGTCYFFDGDQTVSLLEDKSLDAQIAADAAAVLAGKSSVLKQYSAPEQTAFVELLQPPVSLVIVGAGNDALPLADIAFVLGWQTTIIDGRSTHANRQRFPKVDRLIVAKPEEAKAQIAVDKRTVFVLMTHNYNYDLAMLELLLPEKCPYIGTLGPKKRLQRMLAELQDKGLTVTSEQQALLYGPTGLDIGSEGAEEIALAILSEIKAVLAQRRGTFLRDKTDVLHERPATSIDQTIRAQR